MKKRTFRINLLHRLVLTYALFIGAALGILTLALNQFTGMIFNALIKENINERSREIVRAIGDLYNPLSGGFDGRTTEALGMYFVHEGYIITVEDGPGNPVWDARSCDMEQCVEVINDIAFRMEDNFRLNGGIQKQRYPVYYNGAAVGTVNIETYGPFFYSETESRFLASINRLLLCAGIILALLSAAVSVPLSRSIARPVLKAAEAARRIARAHAPGNAVFGKTNPEGLIRINDQYKTRELRELSRSINDLASELEEGERRQKQLTADVAHELRTPLTCLLGNMEAMIDGVYAPDRERLVSCHEEILRLTSLVEDLNILTSLEGEGADVSGPQNPVSYGANNLNKTDFDLDRLLRVTAEQFRGAAQKKGIPLRLELIKSPVNADYDRLKQVFMNLLSNAIKYTDSGTITVAVKNRDITISDTGIGIPAKDLPHVFERFYRTDKSRSRSTGGAGIGLAIAAAIISAHGGSITAENNPSGGSIFRVRL
ncbi:MAG: HAMP domain-containing histidine kinase [Spirochaetaceae bacterium]|jgi:signal transduction histidine kinase|nr:HAMP domain-containing histidine kinase [Spirochaetaceae bacterium]